MAADVRDQTTLGFWCFYGLLYYIYRTTSSSPFFTPWTCRKTHHSDSAHNWKLPASCYTNNQPTTRRQNPDLPATDFSSAVSRLWNEQSSIHIWWKKRNRLKKAAGQTLHIKPRVLWCWICIQRTMAPCIPIPSPLTHVLHLSGQLFFSFLIFFLLKKSYISSDMLRI